MAQFDTLQAQLLNYLELVSSFDKQARYERNVFAHGAPGHVPHEVINQWEDMFPFGPPTARLPGQDWGFSLSDAEALRRFHAAWDVAGDDDPEGVSVTDLFDWPQWIVMHEAAMDALRVLKLNRPFT